MGTMRNVVTTAGLGAAAMYLFDPERGERRRALLRDKLTRLANVSDRALNKVSDDLANRLQGAAAEFQSLGRDGSASDDVIVARVRSQLGRVCAHPGAIEVTAQGGRVTLSGDVLADEAEVVVARVGAVRGVQSVTNRLHASKNAADVPALQGGRKRTGNEPEFLRAHWNPTARFSGGIVGAGLTIYGLARGGLGGLVAGVPGALLLLRSLTDKPISQLTGLGAGRQAVYQQKELDIQAPIGEVYEFWRRFESFSLIFPHIDEVREIGPGRTHWVVSGPAGARWEYDAVTTQLIPDQVIAWQSVPGAELGNTGIVRFKSVALGGETEGTRINIRMWYTPPAGVIADTLAGFLDSSLKDELNEAMVRFKSLMETGKTTAHGRRITRQDVIGGQQRGAATGTGAGANPPVH
ncbi:MAG TPA: SRPBCC family protein [Ktedonobacterales bacterium]|nr:SRPBCC family protein [Ktedonobacterales bacterium]